MQFFSTRNLAAWFQSLVAVAVTISASGGIAKDNDAFHLRDGDRVVFYGDSITEQAHYTLPIEIYLAARHPELDVSLVNSGWGGDHSWGGPGGTAAERLKRDVLPYKPSVVTVMLGMNDGYYTNFDQKALDVFNKSIEELIGTLKTELPHVRIILIGTSPYDNVTPGAQPDWEKAIEGGYDGVIARYSQAMGEIAARRGLPFVDMHQPLVELLNELQVKDPELARELIPDRIHPGKAAGLVMAAELLKAWHVPQLNKHLEMDAKGSNEAHLVFHQQLGTPYPIEGRDRLTKYLLKSTDHLALFAPPQLRVENLSAEWAQLTIDGNEVGVFTAKELSEGIELSPQIWSASRADELARLVEARARLHFVKWRELEIPAKKQSDEIGRAIKQLDEIESDLRGLQTDLAKPARHVIEIRRAER